MAFDPDLTIRYGSRWLNWFLRPRLECLLARLLMNSLRGVLRDLDYLKKRGRRGDWHILFLTIYWILFGVKYMAVNLHIFTTKVADNVDERIETEGLGVLLDRFNAYT
jgi:hypothetical protein